MSNKYPGGFVSLGGPTPSNSVLFNGSNQYLSIPDNAALEVGSSSFTAEAWIYLTASVPANGASVINKSNSGSYGPFSLGSSPSGYLQFVASTSGSNWEVNLTDATQTLQLGTWYHIAGVRSGSNFYLFKNGILVASGSNAGTLIDNAETMKIGWVNYASTYFPGFISNVRLVIGTALYTANFTPPTGPLQNITNTVLLTCQSPTIVDNSTANGGSGWTITNNNGAIVSTQAPFQSYNPNNLDPALGAATPGVWTLSQALAAEVTRSWPMYDPYYKNVVLNLHGNGTNGAQNNTFLDASGNNFTITRNGNTTQGSFSPYGSGWSNYFDASGDYIDLASNAAFSFGTGDFTVEMWLYHVSNGAQRIIGNYTSSANTEYDIEFQSGGYIYFGSYNTYTLSSTAVSLNTWTHIAWVRAGGVETLYINGVSAGSATRSINFSSTSGPRIAGSKDLTVNLYEGYISNLRIVKGTAVYNGTFTPSTTPLTAISGTSLLTCQSNRFVDNSSNAFALTVNGNPSVQRFQPFLFNTSYTPSTIGGSGYFDGTGDSLTCTGSFPSTGDFTLSMWVYPSSLPGYTLALSQSGTGNVFYLALGYSDGKIDIQVGGNYADYTAGVYKANQWNYVQIVKSSSAYSVYVNGTALSVTGSSGNIGTTAIGTGTLTVTYNTGCYITDVRLVTSALSNTVPTAPLTAVSGTTMLLSMQNGAIYDNAAMNDLETVGNAQISTSVKKYGTGSMSFPTTGDYLTTLATSNLSFGTGDFTVEGWMYFNTVGSDMTLFTGTTNGNISIRIVSSQIRVGTLGVSWDTSSATQSFSTATWYHFAVVRSSGTITFYLNGVSIGSGANTNAYNVSAGATIAQAGGGAHLDGYLDDLRITKGVARYVANFTPPTSQLQDQ